MLLRNPSVASEGKSITKVSTSWVSKRTKTMKDFQSSFESEVQDFVDYIRPSAFDLEGRTRAFNFLKMFFESKLPETELILFGSSRLGVYLPNADIDVTLLSASVSETKVLSIMACQLLKQNPRYFDQIEVIASAKVPLVRLILREFRFRVDISFNVLDGFWGTEFMTKGLAVYPKIEVMLYLLKALIKRHKLNCVFKRGISCFVLFCLLRHFFDSREVEKKDHENCFYELLVGFLRYYGTVFDANKHRLVFRDVGSRVEPKVDCQLGLEIINSTELPWTVSDNFGVQRVFEMFRKEWNN